MRRRGGAGVPPPPRSTPGRAVSITTTTSTATTKPGRRPLGRSVSIRGTRRGERRQEPVAEPLHLATPVARQCLAEQLAMRVQDALPAPTRWRRAVESTRSVNSNVTGAAVIGSGHTIWSGLPKSVARSGLPRALGSCGR